MNAQGAPVDASVLEIRQGPTEIRHSEVDSASPFWMKPYFSSL